MPFAHLRRREFITLLGGACSAAATSPLGLRSASAQQVPKVGLLYPGPAAAAPSRITDLLEGLRTGGFRSPEQFELLPRIADGDYSRLPALAHDLVARKVDVIVAPSPPAIDAAVQVTRASGSNVPIVASSFETDPVRAGLVQSLHRPGGNVTGVFLAFPEFGNKWIELLKELAPELVRVAALWDPVTGDMQLRAVQAAGRTLNVAVEVVAVRTRAEFDDAFAAARRYGAGAVVILGSPLFGAEVKSLADLALRHRFPAVTLFTHFPRAGGLIAYGPNISDPYRIMGSMAAKILQGRRPAELPVELYSRYELAVNLKTAEALGIEVPPSILLRADEVIE
jgi:putative tryptophan/tyrosine transport system substrate-binding protein